MRRSDGAWVNDAFPGERFWHRHEPDIEKLRVRESMAHAIRLVRSLGDRTAARRLLLASREVCQ